MIHSGYEGKNRQQSSLQFGAASLPVLSCIANKASGRYINGISLLFRSREQDIVRVSYLNGFGG